MKHAKLLLTLLVTFMVGGNVGKALTTDDLAAFLGIYSWHTVVDIPPDSYSLQIFRFADGKVADADLLKVTKLTKEQSNDVTILVGTEEGKYRWMIRNAGGSYGSPTSDPKLERTCSPPLPEKVQEGDFLLLGAPLEGRPFNGSTDLHSYSKGYLLRIKKKNG